MPLPKDDLGTLDALKAEQGKGKDNFFHAVNLWPHHVRLTNIHEVKSF